MHHCSFQSRTKIGAVVYRCRFAARSVVLLGLAACATSRSRIPQGTGPDVVIGSPVTGIALLGTLHVSDPVRTLTDSLLQQRLSTACPSVTILVAAETERRLAARHVVAPRQLSASFAREAREALGVDLLIAPMTLGLTYDTRTTVAGIMDVISRPAAYSFEDRAGIALEGWDLRTASQTVRVIRTHASENSWTARPEQLLQDATTDAVRRLTPLCAPLTTSASAPSRDTPSTQHD